MCVMSSMDTPFDLPPERSPCSRARWTTVVRRAEAARVGATMNDGAGPGLPLSLVALPLRAAVLVGSNFLDKSAERTTGMARERGDDGK